VQVEGRVARGGVRGEGRKEGSKQGGREELLRVQTQTSTIQPLWMGRTHTA